MKTFKELRRELEEHPRIGARIVKAINPMDKIKDKMDKLKKAGGLTGIMKDKMQDALDKVNPMSVVNKAMTLKRKEKIKKLSDKKQKLTDKSTKISKQIKKIRAKIKKP